MTTAEAVTGQSGFAQVLLQLQDPAENWVSQLSVCRLPDDRQHKRNGSYQSVYAKFMSYHQLNDSLVLAVELSGCTKDGQIPLWDTCRLSLRGFPVTDYLSKKSIQTQVEARWRFYKRWGLVPRCYRSVLTIGHDGKYIIYSAGAANIFFTNTPDFRIPIIEDVVNRPAIIAPVTPQVSTS